MKTLKELMEEMRALQHKWADFGAFDTEPRCMRNDLLSRAVRGEPWKDFDPCLWYLYSIDGVEIAEQELTLKAREMHEAIIKAPHGEVVEFVRHYGI